MDVEGAVDYHYGEFPPEGLDIARHLDGLMRATDKLSRYDQMLRHLPKRDILIMPLRSQEALLSSRLEGTFSTMDEILGYDPEAPSEEGMRNDVQEALLYRETLSQAQEALENGYTLNPAFLRMMHQSLLSSGRGANKSPGEYKREQNYLATSTREVRFTAISPELLQEGIERLFGFMGREDIPLLARVALTHLEFEALHPFQDGNGRIGRMLISMQLWRGGAISYPHFYLSQYLEEHKDEYISRMRAVSAAGEWDAWIAFFLRAIEAQASGNLKIAEAILNCYDEVKGTLERLSPTRSISLLDFLFTRPIFTSTQLRRHLGQAPGTISSLLRALVEADLLKEVAPGRGRLPGRYSFEPLMRIVRV